MRDGPAAAARALADLVAVFGRANVAVELWDHGDPLASARNDALAELAIRRAVDVIATAPAQTPPPPPPPFALGSATAPPPPPSRPPPPPRPRPPAAAARGPRRSLDDM